MAISGVRQGARVRLALKEQSAEGVPATGFVSADIVRADEAGIDPGIEWQANQGTTGQLYSLDTGVIVAAQPTADLLVKASPALLRLLLRAHMSKAPTTSPGPVGTLYEFEGFALDIAPFLTLVYDTDKEAYRITDWWPHTLELQSESDEPLFVSVQGTGKLLAEQVPLLAGLVLTNLVSYTHKESAFYDETNATPIPLALTGFTLKVDQGRTVVSANSVSPTFLGRDGRTPVTGTIRARWYDDTKALLTRLLSLERSTFRSVWTSSDGKTLEVILRNVVVEGEIPDVDADGNLGDIELDLTAHQVGDAEFPFTVTVED